MCCYNTPGHAWGLPASSKEFPKLKAFNKIHIEGQRNNHQPWELMIPRSAWGIHFWWTWQWKYSVIVGWFHAPPSSMRNNLCLLIWVHVFKWPRYHDGYPWCLLFFRLCLLQCLYNCIVRPTDNSEGSHTHMCNMAQAAKLWVEVFTLHSERLLGHILRCSTDCWFSSGMESFWCLK